MKGVRDLIKVRQDEIRKRIVRMGLKGRLRRQMVEYHEEFGQFASPLNFTRKASSPRISGSMKQERFRLMVIFLMTLEELGIQRKYLWDLTPADYERVIGHLIAGEMKVGNLRKHIAAFRALYGWVGESDDLPPNAILLPKAFHRQPTYARRVPTWSHNGVDFEAVLARVPATLAWMAAALQLMRGFGLRLTEALMIDLHLADGVHYLVIYTASKGGRWRLAPIDEPWKRALVDKLKATFPPGQALIGPVHCLSKRAAVGKFHRVLREWLGVSKATYGVVAHGLRAECLCRLYTILTGEEPPILGGAPVAPRRDREARKILAFVSGHGRPHISRYYIGRVQFGWRGTAAEEARPLTIPAALVFCMKHEAKILAKERPRIEAAMRARKAEQTQPSYASQHRRHGKRRTRGPRLKRPTSLAGVGRPVDALSSP